MSAANIPQQHCSRLAAGSFNLKFRCSLLRVFTDKLTMRDRRPINMMLTIFPIYDALPCQTPNLVSGLSCTVIYMVGHLIRMIDNPIRCPKNVPGDQLLTLICIPFLIYVVLLTLLLILTGITAHPVVCLKIFIVTILPTFPQSSTRSIPPRSLDNACSFEKKLLR